jgi:hypothetical protein
MKPEPVVARGAAALRRLLEERTFDLREMDVAGFRRWLEQRMERWQLDPVFAQRTRIRDLRRQHPRLRRMEQALRRAAAEDAASPGFARLQQIERQLDGAGKAIAGLGDALEGASPGSREALRRKLAGFHTLLEELEHERDALVEASPGRQEWLRLHERLSELRREAGLEREEARLRELVRGQGRRSGASGQSFEELALALTREHILPELAASDGSRDPDAWLLLRGVRLGAAGIELDQLVVRTADPGQPAEVLAMIEVKRNPNDLGRGFRQRQEALAWLTRDAARYDPASRRTRGFPQGHFDRWAVHRHEDGDVALGPGSFRFFRREPGDGPFLQRLYFVTRERPLWGVSAAALARIEARIASDLRFRPESAACLRRLLRWCQALSRPPEAPDVLRLYAEAPAHARQILLLGR